MYFILFIAIAVASYAVQASLKSKFSTYSKTPLSNGMTGAQVAEKMLRDNGINNVKVTQIEGQLTDHYNPATLTVNLSRNVYYGSSVAAAVAAHECGHAVQHATKYSFLQLRSNLVPAVSFASNVMPWIHTACRNCASQHLPRASAVRHRLVCTHHTVLLRDTPC